MASPKETDDERGKRPIKRKSPVDTDNLYDATDSEDPDAEVATTSKKTRREQSVAIDEDNPEIGDGRSAGVEDSEGDVGSPLETSRQTPPHLENPSTDVDDSEIEEEPYRQSRRGNAAHPAHPALQDTSTSSPDNGNLELEDDRVARGVSEDYLYDATPSTRYPRAEFPNTDRFRVERSTPASANEETVREASAPISQWAAFNDPRTGPLAGNHQEAPTHPQSEAPLRSTAINDLGTAPSRRHSVLNDFGAAATPGFNATNDTRSHTTTGKKDSFLSRISQLQAASEPQPSGSGNSSEDEHEDRRKVATPEPEDAIDEEDLYNVTPTAPRTKIVSKSKRKAQDTVVSGDEDAPPAKKPRKEDPTSKRKANDADDSSRLAKKGRQESAPQDPGDDGSSSSPSDDGKEGPSDKRSVGDLSDEDEDESEVGDGEEEDESESHDTPMKKAIPSKPASKTAPKPASKPAPKLPPKVAPKLNPKPAPRPALNRASKPAPKLVSKLAPGANPRPAPKRQTDLTGGAARPVKTARKNATPPQAEERSSSGSLNSDDDIPPIKKHEPAKPTPKRQAEATSDAARSEKAASKSTPPQAEESSSSSSSSTSDDDIPPIEPHKPAKPAPKRKATDAAGPSRPAKKSRQTPEPEETDDGKSETSQYSSDEPTKKGNWIGWSMATPKKTVEQEFAEAAKKAAEQVKRPVTAPGIEPLRRSSRSKSTRAATQPPMNPPPQPQKKKTTATAEKASANRVTKSKKAASTTASKSRAGTAPLARKTKASSTAPKRSSTAQARDTRTTHSRVELEIPPEITRPVRKTRVLSQARSRVGSEAPAAFTRSSRNTREPSQASSHSRSEVAPEITRPVRNTRAPIQAPSTRVTRSRVRPVPPTEPEEQAQKKAPSQVTRSRSRSHAGSAASSEPDEEPKKSKASPRKVITFKHRPRNVPASAQTSPSVQHIAQSTLEFIEEQSYVEESSLPPTAPKQKPKVSTAFQQPAPVLPSVEAENENLFETQRYPESDSSVLSELPSQLFYDAEEQLRAQHYIEEEDQSRQDGRSDVGGGNGSAPYAQMEEEVAPEVEAGETQVEVPPPQAVPRPPRRQGNFIMRPREYTPRNRSRQPSIPVTPQSKDPTRRQSLREAQPASRLREYKEPPLQAEKQDKEASAGQAEAAATPLSPERLRDNMARSGRDLDERPPKPIKPKTTGKGKSSRPGLTIFVCGENKLGQLGLGPGTAERKAPVKHELLTKFQVVDFDCSANHCIALTKGGVVYTWGLGAGHEGALGTKYVTEEGTRSRAKSVDIPKEDNMVPGAVDLKYLVERHGKIVKVVATDDASFALTDKGQVLGWGTFKTPDANGDYQVVGLRSDNKIVHRPEALGGWTGIAKLAAGGQHILALDKKDNKMYAMGNNHKGQLGFKPDTQSIRKRGVMKLRGEVKAEKIACGENTSYCIDKNGRLYAWGDNTWAQLGRGEAGGHSYVPKLCDVLDDDQRQCRIAAVAGGAAHTLTCTDYGEIYSWGQWENYAHGIYKHENGEGVNMDYVELEEEGEGEIAAIVWPHKIPYCDGIVNVAAGSHHSIIMDDDGDVYTFGLSDRYQTGHEVFFAIEEPKKLEAGDITDFNIIRAAAGKNFTMLVGVPKPKNAKNARRK